MEKETIILKRKLAVMLSVMAMTCALCVPVSAGNVISPGSENTKPGVTNKSATSPKTGEGMEIAYAALIAAGAAGIAAGANKKRKEA